MAPPPIPLEERRVRVGGGDGKGLITHLQINSGSGLLGCLQARGMGWGGDL